MNLTAIREPEEIVTRHFGESLFVARHLFPKGAWAERTGNFDSASDERPTTSDASLRLADVGSGAGFPGIPIKLWAPEIALTLIEANHKKTTFLREVIRALTLTNVDIRNVRAETLLEASFEVVTLRAVERLTDLLAISSASLIPGGCLALLIAESQLISVRSATPDVSWRQAIPIPTSHSRVLFLGTLEPKSK